MNVITKEFAHRTSAYAYVKRMMATAIKETMTAYPTLTEQEFWMLARMAVNELGSGGKLKFGAACLPVDDGVALPALPETAEASMPSPSSQKDADAAKSLFPEKADIEVPQSASHECGNDGQQPRAINGQAKRATFPLPQAIEPCEALRDHEDGAAKDVPNGSKWYCTDPRDTNAGESGHDRAVGNDQATPATSPANQIAGSEARSALPEKAKLEFPASRDTTKPKVNWRDYQKPSKRTFESQVAVNKTLMMNTFVLRNKVVGTITMAELRQMEGKTQFELRLIRMLRGHAANADGFATVAEIMNDDHLARYVAAAEKDRANV